MLRRRPTGRQADVAGSRPSSAVGSRPVFALNRPASAGSCRGSAEVPPTWPQSAPSLRRPPQAAPAWSLARPDPPLQPGWRRIAAGEPPEDELSHGEHEDAPESVRSEAERQRKRAVEAQAGDVEPPSPQFDAGEDSLDPVTASIMVIKNHIFRRRVRMKEFFAEFDGRRCGRCTNGQFARALSNIIYPNLLDDLETPIYVEELTEHCTEYNAPLEWGDQVVLYLKLCEHVDTVFNIHHLESSPTAAVPRPGTGVLDVGGFVPRPVADEDAVWDVLRKIAALTIQRALQLSVCFDDCKRTDADKRSGRMEPEKFLMYFPLARSSSTKPAALSKEEMCLLLQRYTDENGFFRLHNLERDIEAILADKEETRKKLAQNAIPRPKSAPAARAKGRAKRLPALGGQGQRHKLDVMTKLQCLVLDRQTRLQDRFVDFDRLRRGTCTFTQLKTVLTVLKIELNRDEYDELFKKWRSPDGLFDYRGCCAMVDEAMPGANVPGPRCTAGGGAFAARALAAEVKKFKAPPDIGKECAEKVEELQNVLAKRVKDRGIDLLSVFDDFCATRWAKPYHVTRDQFARAMDMLGLKMNEDQRSLICDVYGDMTGNEMNYVDFCTAVDSSCARAMTRTTLKNKALAEQAMPGKKANTIYFGDSGQIKPLRARSYSAPSLRARAVARPAGKKSGVL